MNDLIDSYRKRAGELREQAEDRLGEPIAPRLRNLAQLYDETADALERREKSAPLLANAAKPVSHH